MYLLVTLDRTSIHRERVGGSAWREGVASGKVSWDGCSWEVLKKLS